LPLRHPPRLARRQPVSKLEPAEKPHWTPKSVSILEPDQLTHLLPQAGDYRFLFEFLAFTGLRIGEALGLTWADIKFDAGLIHVHRPRESAPRAQARQPLQSSPPTSSSRTPSAAGSTTATAAKASAKR
jgi:integrase